MKRTALVMAVGVRVAVASCLLLACGGDDGGGGTPIADQPMRGKIGGQGWTFATGETNAFLSMGETLFVQLYPSVFTVCEAGFVDGNSFIFEIPKVAGSYDLGLTRTATFYDSATAFNRIATRGRIVIDSVSATAISGGANVIFDDANLANGKFQATICP